LAPWSAAAALALFLAVTGKLNIGPARSLVAARGAQEIETPLDEMSVISFRSDTEGISVVWIQ
jgi:hypothetical protein